MRPKHKTFADEWLIDQNGQKAAERAGYSAKYARITANKILQRPEVQAYLKEKMGLRAMESDEALELLGKMARSAESETVQVRALENIIKVHGLTERPVEGELVFRVLYGSEDTPEEATPETAGHSKPSGQEEGNLHG